MINEELLRTFPSKRIKPFDGMAVTANVWEEAHDYHRHLQRFHTLLYHGTGIVTGLEVVASDPPDTVLYIMPGIAVDSYGQAIVIGQPVSFDFDKKAEGLLYLLLTYDESRPRSLNGRTQDDPLYVHEYFSIQVAQSIPEGPYVELARLRRVGRDAPILDAGDPLHPASNEIDLRFRRLIGMKPQRVATMAVSYLGRSSQRQMGLGLDSLARQLTRNTSLQVQVDDDVPLNNELARYSLLALVGTAGFQLRTEEIMALRHYLKGGGTLYLESRRQNTGEEPPSSDRSFEALLKDLSVQVAALPQDHRLLHDPYLFAAPPPGFETRGKPTVQVGEGVIWSTHDYIGLWEGKQRDSLPSREAIRSAIEWGQNIVEYALERQIVNQPQQRRASPSRLQLEAQG